MKVSWVHTLILLLICLSLSACNSHTGKPYDDGHAVTVTTPQLKSLTLTQQYAGQIQSQHHVEVSPG